MSQWVVSLPDRLDAFLAADGRSISRGKAQKAIDDGRVTVNDEVITKASFRLQEGDVVELTEAETVAAFDDMMDPVDMKLNVLYEDKSCMVIDKPAGFAVHPGAGMSPGEQTILHGAAFLYKERSLPFSASSVLAHRLDKETTGCLLLAKDPASHVALQKQFEERTIEKTYLALTAGLPSPPDAVIDAPVGRSVSDRTVMAVRAVSGARDARTTYRTLATKENVALLACDLHTGRTHQIRVHLHAIGFPILGDSTYTSPLSERLNQEYDIRTLMLHAWKLSFDSPANGKRQKVEAALPSSFEEALQGIGFEWKN